jgi:hypothetical protein
MNCEEKRIRKKLSERVHSLKEMQVFSLKKVNV